MLTSQKALFQLPQDLTYLNAAYMSPQLKRVEAAGLRAVTLKNDPSLIQPSDFFTESDEVKMLFAQLIKADPEQVVLIPSVSYGMANVAHNLPLEAGKKIIMLGEQFPSNVYPWMAKAEEKGATLQWIEAPGSEEPDRARKWNERILEAIDEHTALLSLSANHWSDGTLFDLQAIRNKTRAFGAWMVIDGTQSVGALPIDVEKLQPEALICAAYKWLMGPYSIGFAYYDKKLNEGRPIENNWIQRKDSDHFNQLVRYQKEYGPGAQRYEVGEKSNFVLMPMMKEALLQVLEWSPEAIQEYCGHISHFAVEALREAGFWIEQDPYRAAHLFGIRLAKNVSMQKVQERLEKDRIKISIRGTALRVSPHVYNSQEDMEKLKTALIG